MKKIFTLVLLFATLFFGSPELNAQVDIGSGTTTNTTTQASPINIWFRSMHYQVVYTATELMAAGAVPGDTISELGWYVTGVPINALPNYSIKMKHTTAIDASTYDGAGLTNLVTVPLHAPTAGGYDMTTFTTTFVWNGSNNILVDVCFDQVTSFNASGQQRTYAGSSRSVRNDGSTQCAVATNGNATYKPQVRLTMFGGVPPSCPSPSNLTTTNITATSATLNWTTGGSPVWFTEYGPAGFTPGTGTLTSTNPLNITGLTAATSYDWYVRDFCTLGDTSFLIGPQNFTTPFLTPNGVVCVTGGSSILFSEDFENTAVSGTPVGWTGSFGTFNAWEVTPPNTNSFNTGPNIAVSGAQHLEFQAGTNSNASVISPSIDLTTANDEVELAFYMHAFGTGMGTFNINVSTSPAGPFTSVFTYSGNYQTTANDPWEHIGVDLTAYLGQVIYLQFNNVSANFLGDFAIDQVIVTSCVSCPAPSAFTTTNITSSSVDLAWTTGGSAVWLVEYGPTGFTPGSGDSTILATLPSLTITGLNAATSYDFYVQDFCGLGDSSLQVGALGVSTEFLTPDGVACVTGGSSILFSADFENTAISGTPAGWTGSFGTFNAWEVTPANQNSFNTGPNVAISGTQHLEFQAGTNSNASAVTPAINLSTSNDEVELSFYMHAFGTGMGTFNVNVSTSPAGPFTSVFTYSGNYQSTANDPWVHIAVDLTAYIGQTIYLQFNNTSTNFLGDVAVDLIEVRSCVTCPAPTAFTTSNVTSTSVDLAWITGGSAVWLVEYGPTGFTPGSGDSTILAVTPSLTVTGLNAATSYDFYVQDFCGLGDSSIQVGALNIATDFLSPDGVICNTGDSSILFSEDFENTAISANPSGWIGNFGTFSAWEVTPANQNSFNTGPNVAVSGTQHLEFQAGTNVSAFATSPAVNLTTSNDEVELAFYMHAFGTGMGTFNINIGTSQTGPFTPIFTYSGNSQTTANDLWEHIAVDLTPYIGQVVYLQFANTSSTFLGDIAIDKIEVTSCLTCPVPADILVSGVTESTADVAWTTGGAFAWLLEYGPAGFTPGSGDSTFVTATNPTTITGLNASTVYDVYVYDFCALGDTSFGAGPGRFATDCDTVVAPYYESFDFALADPHCWSSAGTDPWRYRNSLTTGGFPAPQNGVANSIDHTSGTGNFAWVDASGFPGINANELITPVIDYSGLTQGIVGLWIKSFNNTNNNTVQNQIQIEGWNGAAWDSIINYSGNFDGWRRVYANIPASLPTITSFRVVQINDPTTNSVWANDLLVDDFFVEEAPTCFNPTMLVSTIIDPTTVELSWVTGGATDWIIEYGAPGFLPGTGAGTIINTTLNPYTLPVNSGQDYDWYVQDDCGAGDISWYSYVDEFRMPGEVLCDSVSTNFTYCHPDESEEVYTYQSDNGASFLHIVFNSGTVANFVDFVIYDGPDNTFPILFSSTGNTDMTGMEFVTSGPFVAFSYNSIFANPCNIPFDFDINCCETTTFSQVVNICVDSSYTLPDGVVVDAEAAYYSTIENVKGCDSVVTTIINILEDSTTVSDIICAGSSYLLPDGVTTFGPGNFQMVVSNYLGCDSAIDLTLTLAQPSSSSVNASICAGDSYQMPNGTFVSTAGVHSLMYTNAAGCDSTYTVNLSLNAATSESISEAICEGSTYTLTDGTVVSSAGVYTSQSLNLDGCAHTTTTTLTVNISSFAQDSIEICGEETYTLLNGDVVSDGGEYNVNVGNSAGCDSIVTIYVSKCIVSGITGDEGNAVVSIFPNPSSNMINVSFNTDVVNSNLDVRVMNALGQEVVLIENISDNSLVINVSTYADGFYYLVVNDDLNTSIKKFVVSK